MKLMFYFSLGLLTYIFLGYPLLVGLSATLRNRKTKKRDFFPSVSILLSVYNEEKCIKNRIANLRSLKYPKEKLEILAGSDGSADGTNEILRSLAPPHLSRKTTLGHPPHLLGGRATRCFLFVAPAPSPTRGEELKVPVRVFIFPERRGKPSVLNDLAKEAGGEILVFADCRQQWDENGLERLARNFSDEKIGVVSGLVKEEGGGFYRKYENFIRNAEGSFSSVPGATGAIYGMRKKLFKPLPPDTILDDFVLPMEAVRRGYRSIIEPEATAYDCAFTLPQEKIRKIRTLAGNFQAFFFHPWLLNPAANPAWFQTFSHKFLRLLAPVFLLFQFLTNLLLWKTGPPFRVFFLLQVSFLLLGLAGKHLERKYKILSVFAAFLELNWTTVLGFRDFVTGKQAVTWNKTEGRSATNKEHAS